MKRPPRIARAFRVIRGWVMSLSQPITHEEVRKLLLEHEGVDVGDELPEDWEGESVREER